MMIVRLHSSAKHCFRFEIFNEQSLVDFGRVVGILCNASKDISLPGYPYGLIKADKLARVGENERKYLKTRFLSNTDDSTIHDVLDNFY